MESAKTELSDDGRLIVYFMLSRTGLYQGKADFWVIKPLSQTDSPVYSNLAKN
jgi:hypothetical protein